MSLALNVKNECDVDLCSRCKIVWFDFQENDEIEKATQEPINRLKFPSQFKNDLIYGNNSELSTSTQIMSLFLPSLREEESDRFKIDTWGTWILCLLCFFVSLYCFKDLDQAVNKYGFFKNSAFIDLLVRNFTSFFVHAGWFHLLYNVYFLWMFGDNTENELGTTGFLFLVFFGTTLGHLFFKILSPDSQLISIGASGGIFAIMTYYVLKFPHRRFTYFFFGNKLSISTITYSVFFMMLPTALGLLAQFKNQTSISHLSHLGGALAGLLVYFITDKK